MQKFEYNKMPLLDKRLNTRNKYSFLLISMWIFEWILWKLFYKIIFIEIIVTKENKSKIK